MTNKHVELIMKKEFAATALNLKYETFIVYVASLNFNSLNIHLSYRPQIAGMIAEEASTKIFTKYVNFTNVFSSDLIPKLPKYTKINNYTIKLVDS